MRRLLPETTSARRLKQAIRALATVTSSGCWILASSPKKIRPQVRMQGKYIRLYRLVYRVWRKRPSKNVCHTCDNPRCFYPRHLFHGTQRANLRDMHRKGRHWAQKRRI